MPGIWTTHLFYPHDDIAPSPPFLKDEKISSESPWLGPGGGCRGLPGCRSLQSCSLNPILLPCLIHCRAVTPAHVVPETAGLFSFYAIQCHKYNILFIYYTGFIITYSTHTHTLHYKGCTRVRWGVFLMWLCIYVRIFHCISVFLILYYPAFQFPNPHLASSDLLNNISIILWLCFHFYSSIW